MVDGGCYDGPCGRLHGSGREIGSPIETPDRPLNSWYCNPCAKEVYTWRCPVCGKSKEEKT